MTFEKKMEYSICVKCTAVTYKYSDGFLYRPYIDLLKMCKPGKCENTTWNKMK